MVNCQGMGMGREIIQPKIIRKLDRIKIVKHSIEHHNTHVIMSHLQRRPSEFIKTLATRFSPLKYGRIKRTLYPSCGSTLHRFNQVHILRSMESPHNITILKTRLYKCQICQNFSPVSAAIHSPPQPIQGLSCFVYDALTVIISL